MNTLLRGVAIGFAIAAPVGPIGLLCITRSLSFGFTVGFVSGIGAAVADALYGAIAVFGLKAAIMAVHALERPLHIVGAIVLIAMGVRTIVTQSSSNRTAEGGAPTIGGAFASTFALTAVNPLTIVSFAAVVSAAGVSGKLSAAGFLVFGVFLGSALWWLVLAGSVSLIHKRINVRLRRVLNVVSGALLVLIGIAFLFLRA